MNSANEKARETNRDTVSISEYHSRLKNIGHEKNQDFLQQPTPTAATGFRDFRI
jgi:hypothetical protein